MGQRIGEIMSVLGDYSIPIYPDGNRNKPHRLTFKTKILKEEYIRRETIFCWQSLSDYNKALFSKEGREPERIILDLNRVKFAVSEGYHPLRVRGTLWVKQSDLEITPEDT